jgi:hypothetical protein
MAKNAKMTRYPILFGFRDLVAGNGFAAGISVNGRALLVNEGDGFWMYGVNPGGLAAGGTSHGEAQAEFRQGYRSVLFDIAIQAADFDSFRREVRSFFQETNESTEQEWNEALAEVRKGNVIADWLPTRKTDPARLGIEVVLLEHPQPSLNGLDQAELAA